MIKLTPTLEAEAARLAARHGWSLDVVRGFALARMHANVYPDGAYTGPPEERALHNLENDLIQTLEPDPPCELCGRSVPMAAPNCRVICDPCQRMTAPIF
jgi:hypothetical protein